MTPGFFGHRVRKTRTGHDTGRIVATGFLPTVGEKSKRPAPAMAPLGFFATVAENPPRTGHDTRHSVRRGAHFTICDFSELAPGTTSRGSLRPDALCHLSQSV
jgi:hypothetical protein